jgi:hypothetical protein
MKSFRCRRGARSAGGRGLACSVAVMDRLAVFDAMAGSTMSAHQDSRQGQAGRPNVLTARTGDDEHGDPPENVFQLKADPPDVGRRVRGRQSISTCIR